MVSNPDSKEFQEIAAPDELQLVYGVTKITLHDTLDFSQRRRNAHEDKPLWQEQANGLLEKSSHAPSAYTLRETLKVPSWQSEIHGICEQFLSTEIGQKILLAAEIRTIQDLTPDQAMFLSTAIVRALAEYDMEHIKSRPNEGLGETGTREISSYTQDNKSAIEILRTATAEITSGKPVSPNGVCRNYASCVVAVFEALKYAQNNLGRLNSTFCIYEGGREELFMPTHKDPRLEGTSFENIYKGHAWNRFITYAPTGESHTVTDATWAQLEEDGRLAHYEFTLIRSHEEHRLALQMALLRESNPEKKRALFEQMLEFTEKIIQHLLEQGFVLDEELQARLEMHPDYKNLVEVAEQRGKSPQEARQLALEALFESYRKNLKRPRINYYIHQLLNSVFDYSTLAPQQKKRVNTLLETFIDTHTEYTVSALLKTGSSPQTVRNTLLELMPTLADSPYPEDVILKNPWLQVWIYASTDQRAEKVKSALNYYQDNNHPNVWHFTPAHKREHSPDEPHYRNANEFWYDLWKEYTFRQERKGNSEAMIVSFQDKTLKMFLDVLVHLWDRQAQAMGNDRLAKPEEKRRVYSFEQTLELLNTFIERAGNGYEEGTSQEISASSGDRLIFRSSEIQSLRGLVIMLQRAKLGNKAYEQF